MSSKNVKFVIQKMRSKQNCFYKKREKQRQFKRVFANKDPMEKAWKNIAHLETVDPKL